MRPQPILKVHGHESNRPASMKITAWIGVWADGQKLHKPLFIREPKLLLFQGREGQFFCATTESIGKRFFFFNINWIDLACQGLPESV